MYVYKKKCDEEYYISIIRSTQQQIMYQNQNRLRPNYPSQSPIPYFNNSYLGPIPYPNNNSFTPNFNSNNYYNPFKTPENRNYNYSYNNYYNNVPYNNKDLSEISPSPIKSRAEMKYGYHNNGNKKHILEDQILYNKLNNINGISINHSNQNLKKVSNDEYKYNQNYRNYNPNYNNYNQINKKVFKLEDFLSESKKNNLSDRFNRAANDAFN